MPERQSLSYFTELFQYENIPVYKNSLYYASPVQLTV
ncbi:hypothetical protein VCHA50P415_120094 [Vibrio chagasii]|nr:hypothetical protein VCHA27O13_170094 [Vibrio chagasii]CAH6797970.1 hypothetical protein VCHA28O22_110025 [Vibrio chagasii]CAH6807947.1 hypothetical protein VCHA36O163_130025 [Vibrio chagasii]CAH6811292.1 hypothetical protein VCHA31O71_130077 [Vibrio chagasii]CAH6818735.1 hypothetical protein VCHA34P121_140094 [Vibrio chagasii]